MITVNNPEALGKKYDYVSGIETKDGVVTAWPDSLPPLTQALVDQAEAEYIASKIYTPIDFFERFTKTERKAIRTAAKSNDDLEDWLDMLKVAGSVDVSSQRTIDGMAALVAGGLLTQQRSDEILS